MKGAAFAMLLFLPRCHATITDQQRQDADLVADVGGLGLAVVGLLIPSTMPTPPPLPDGGATHWQVVPDAPLPLAVAPRPDGG